MEEELHRHQRGPDAWRDHRIGPKTVAAGITGLPTCLVWKWAPIGDGTAGPDVLRQCSSDADGDGFDDAVDCAPINPAINPGAVDIPNNGIDENATEVTSSSAREQCRSRCRVVPLQCQPWPVTDSPGDGRALVVGALVAFWLVGVAGCRYAVYRACVEAGPTRAKDASGLVSPPLSVCQTTVNSPYMPCMKCGGPSCLAPDCTGHTYT